MVADELRWVSRSNCRIHLSRFNVHLIPQIAWWMISTFFLSSRADWVIKIYNLWKFFSRRRWIQRFFTSLCRDKSELRHVRGIIICIIFEWWDLYLSRVFYVSVPRTRRSWLMTPHLISLENVQFRLKGGNLSLYGRFSQHLPSRRRSTFVLFMTSRLKFALKRKRENSVFIVLSSQASLVRSSLVRVVPIQTTVMTVTNRKLIAHDSFFYSFVSIEDKRGANHNNRRWRGSNFNTLEPLRGGIILLG